MRAFVGPTARSSTRGRFDYGQGQRQRSAVPTSSSSLSLLPAKGIRHGAHHPFSNAQSGRETNTLVPSPHCPALAPSSTSASSAALQYSQPLPSPSAFPGQHSERLEPFSTISARPFDKGGSNGLAGAAAWDAPTPAEHTLGGSLWHMPPLDAPTAYLPPPASTDELAVASQADFYAGSPPFHSSLDFSHPPSSLSPDLYSASHQPPYTHSFPCSNPGHHHLNLDPRIAGSWAEWRRSRNSPVAYASRRGVVSNHVDATRYRTPPRPLSIPSSEAISHTPLNSSLQRKVC
jgi:hypothetical protein